MKRQQKNPVALGELRVSVNDPLDTVLSHYDQPRCSKRPDPNPNEAPFLLESTEESSAGDCCRTRRWHELPSTEADGELTTRGLLYIVLAKAYSRERCKLKKTGPHRTTPASPSLAYASPPHTHPAHLSLPPSLQVSIHYRAYFGDTTSSSEFDSTFRRGRPFVFQLGADMVIPGLDDGVSNLSLGEVARVVIPPELAWGQRGIPGLVPPNRTVIFDVELLDIRVQDSPRHL